MLLGIYEVAIQSNSRAIARWIFGLLISLKVGIVWRFRSSPAADACFFSEHSILKLISALNFLAVGVVYRHQWPRAPLIGSWRNRNMNLRDLTLRARALLAPKRAERDLHDELSFHIEREAMKLMEQGLPPADARARAQAKFGSTTVAADECRDERGTAFIDNTIGDLQYALRTFRRAPLAALTIVVTVAIGLGVVAVLFTVLNVLLFKTDSVPDITGIYAVDRPQQANGELSQFTRQRFEALRSDTNVFT